MEIDKYVEAYKIISEGTYWNQTGDYEEDWNKLWEELVPATGKCDTVQGEVMRAVGRLYYRYYNDGDKIIFHGPMTLDGESTMNAFGYLWCLSDKEGLKDLPAFPLIDLASSATDEEYKKNLELIANEAVQWVKSCTEKTPNDEDMLDEEFKQVCIDECDLYDPEEEDRDDFDYSDVDDQEEEEED